MQLQSLVDFLEKIFPLELAEDWDNVGLLIGDRKQTIKNVMTCLTIDRAVADEAIAAKVDCIVSHHPFPFHSSKKWTSDTLDGELLLKLASNKIAAYSPHTAQDSALFGINRQLAEGLELIDVQPLYPGTVPATKDALAGLEDSEVKTLSREFKKNGDAPLLGAGRIGSFPKQKTLAELIAQVKDMLQIERLLVVGEDDKPIKRVAIGCGSTDDFIDRAVERGADAFLMGEARFHAYVKARAKGLALVLAGHYATERFASCILAYRISKAFPDLTVKASSKESDPLRIV